MIQRDALGDALAYFRPSEHSRDSASIVLTVGKMREHLAVIEAELAALRTDTDSSLERVEAMREEHKRTLRRMLDRAERMMRTANRAGDQTASALYREEVDALSALPVTNEGAGSC